MSSEDVILSLLHECSKCRMEIGKIARAHGYTVQIRTWCHLVRSETNKNTSNAYETSLRALSRIRCEGLAQLFWSDQFVLLFGVSIAPCCDHFWLLFPLLHLDAPAARWEAVHCRQRLSATGRVVKAHKPYAIQLKRKHNNKKETHQSTCSAQWRDRA